MLCNKGILKKFAKLIGKQLRQSLFFNKVDSLRPATLLKKRPWHRCFPVNFANFLRKAIVKVYLRGLLLEVQTDIMSKSDISNTLIKAVALL